ncbi:MAG: hypothetical protein M1503_02155 [Thaumarchaeota archaeon]|nr:hypothetical protein [Nitrososphaerota archaeon]MCL5317055.1 hypothetical protein [Nitrososphaerota archaeon]
MKIGKEAVIVTAILLVIVPTAFGLAVTPPSLFFGIDPASQDVQSGGSATFIVNIYPQGDWKTGTVTLALVNPPQGISATFAPEKMENIEIDGTTAKMTVQVAADVPQGKVTLTVEGTGTALPQSGPQSADLESKSDITLNIISSAQKTTTTTTANKTSTTTNSSTAATATITSVVTTTVVATTTLTSTIISTERTPGAAPIPNIAASSDTTLAIGALGVAAVLFIAGLLLLQQKTGKVH